MDLLNGDPLDRLTSGKREFGEFGGVNASVEISTTFTVMEAETLPAIFNGVVGPEKGGCYVYGRAFNPTVRHLGRLLAALEGCEAAYPCSSGMAAISSTLLALCNSGDHMVASNTIYGGSHALLKTFLPTKSAITTTFVDITNLEAVAEALKRHPGRTKVLYTEVVSNPTLRVADLRALADLAHSHGAQLVVDNTFTPFVITPRRCGADVVIHSLTKFVSGASDIIAGVVCGSQAFISSLMDFHAGPCMLLGPTMDPRVASELALRLPHLGLRMQEHGRRASTFAFRLAALGAAVTYPGLPDHPQSGLMAAQSNPGYGAGGLLGLDLGTPAKANAFMERLQNRHGFGFLAVSLGYFDSLMSLSAASTSSELSTTDLAASGIGGGYVRMSVGITGSLEERWRQLEDAYRFVIALGPTGTPPFRAVKHTRRPGGGLEALISWPSLGLYESDGEGDATPLPPPPPLPQQQQESSNGAEDSGVAGVMSAAAAAVGGGAQVGAPRDATQTPSPAGPAVAGSEEEGDGEVDVTSLSSSPSPVATAIATVILRPLPAKYGSDEVGAGVGEGEGGKMALRSSALVVEEADAGALLRPVKIRRTKSGEIHYVAMN